MTLTGCSQETKLDKMILQLRSAEFSDVLEAKDSIINYGEEAIPKLIKLLNDKSFVKLKNTADLIYPGADKFYGHGWIVHYDIDWISDRAAWLLEEITFQDFGYRILSINDDSLMNLHFQNYQSYLQTGSHKVDFKDKKSKQQLIVIRQMLADSVSKWWNRNKNTWTRFNTIKEGLSSNSEKLQRSMLQYLLFDKTACPKLTLDSYQKELRPLVEIIQRSKNSQADLANSLLEDKEFNWFKMKTEKNWQQTLH